MSGMASKKEEHLVETSLVNILLFITSIFSTDSLASSIVSLSFL